MSNTLKYLIISTFIIALVCLSYYYLDRSIVTWLHAHHTRQWHALHWISDGIPRALCIALTGYCLIYALSIMLSKPIGSAALPVVYTTASTFFVKSFIKKIFGRYWTGTFVCNNPSFVRDHVYGFNWFTSGSAYESFPSGTTAITVACMVGLHRLYPGMSWLWAIIGIAVALSQIVLYYHFLSDVIAGAALGGLIAHAIHHHCTHATTYHSPQKS
ncbi:MAG: phosphatase PAP2 family protein [Legionellales bacterium]|nr:phosphatase PAP2 family protein [Legionellales bacterium]